MEKIRFTTRWLDSLRPGTPAQFGDSETHGFQVWIGKGTIAFYLVIKHHGRQIHKRIGRYPDMKLEEARAIVMKHLGALANYEKLEAPARLIPTIGDAIDLICSGFRKENTRNAYRSYLKLFSHLRNRKIPDVSHAEIVRIHSEAEHPAAANRAVKVLATAISRLYQSIGITDFYNPARGVKLYPEHPRKRFLDEREAPAVIQELERLAKQPLYRIQALALLMMIYTGQRKSNVLAMDYSEIWNGETWMVPGDKAKGGEDIAVPLNDFARDILRRAAGGEALPKSGAVFLRRGARMADVRKTLATACRRCGIADLHIHDLRRSLGSWMLMNGADIAVVSRTLGHKSIAVTEKVYAHLLPGKISAATQSAIEAMRKGKA